MCVKTDTSSVPSTPMYCGAALVERRTVDPGGLLQGWLMWSLVTFRAALVLPSKKSSLAWYSLGPGFAFGASLPCVTSEMDAGEDGLLTLAFLEGLGACTVQLFITSLMVSVVTSVCRKVPRPLVCLPLRSWLDRMFPPQNSRLTGASVLCHPLPLC